MARQSKLMSTYSRVLQTIIDAKGQGVTIDDINKKLGANIKNMGSFLRSDDPIFEEKINGVVYYYYINWSKRER